jgi:hypothetical protein
MTKLPPIVLTVAAAEAALAEARDALTEAQAAHSAAQRAFRDAREAEKAQRERDARNRTSRDRRKAQALAKRYGVSIEREDYGDGRYGYWVLGPWSIYGDGDGIADTEQFPLGKVVRADPCEGDHIAYDWSEVLHNIGIYVADIEASKAKPEEG